MEEMKNEQPEEVIEQRPSTKYGRTAYQEQLRQEQAAREKGFSEYGQQNVDAGAQQSWQEQYQAYTPYEEPKVQVKNTFAYILMVLVALSAIVNCVVSMMTMDVFVQLETIDVMEVVDALMESDMFAMLSSVGDLIFWPTIAFFVLDIITLSKANHKVVGAVLFAIFLRPAYFIWRAHLLGQKKLGSILYTVGYYAFCVIEYIMLFRAAFDLVLMLGY